jgi:hypothetical protein
MALIGKEVEIFEIIKKLNEKKYEFGIDLGQVFHIAKSKGIYLASFTLSQCIRRIESKGYIKVRNWHIIEVNENP